jgi:type IV secretory pathway VirB10-like protein
LPQAPKTNRGLDIRQCTRAHLALLFDSFANRSIVLALFNTWGFDMGDVKAVIPQAIDAMGTPPEALAEAPKPEMGTPPEVSAEAPKPEMSTPPEAPAEAPKPEMKKVRRAAKKVARKVGPKKKAGKKAKKSAKKSAKKAPEAKAKKKKAKKAKR